MPSRAASLAGIAAPLSFVSAWAVAGARTKDYSPVQDFISDLARVGAPTRPLMTAGFVGFGLLAPVWARTLPTRALRTSVTAAGAGTLAVAALPLGASWGDAPHAAAAAVSYVAMAATPVLGAQLLGGRLAQATGVASGLMLAGSLLGHDAGLLQRAGLGVVDAWIVATALRQLPPMSLLLALDLIGVFVFAVSGASLAVEKQLDLFGVLVLSVVTALGGGLLRDVLLGVRPASLEDQRYLVAALVAGVLVFLGSSRVHRVAGTVRLFDAAGLGLFVATGTAKALDAGLGAVPAITLGCLTGIGGGMARDVLVGVVPVVLRRELYAVPAVLGATIVTVGDGVGTPVNATAAVAAVAVFALRMLGVWRDWHFPVARQ